MPSDIVLALEEANMKIREMTEGYIEIRDVIMPEIVRKMARLEEENSNLKDEIRELREITR